MKKTIFITAFACSALFLGAADFKTLCAEAAKAMGTKNYTAASAKYEEAVKKAQTSREKRAAIVGKYNALKKLTRWKEADDYVLKTVDSDEVLKSQDIRFLLSLVAGGHLWDRHYEKALSILQQAQNIQAPKGSNEYYIVPYYMATIYLSRKKQYSAAIETMKDVITQKGLHPANRYTGNMLIGSAYEKMGKKAEALRHYKTALEYGKKVQYKYNYSEAEKAVKRLSE